MKEFLCELAPMSWELLKKKHHFVARVIKILRPFLSELWGAILESLGLQLARCTKLSFCEREFRHKRMDASDGIISDLFGEPLADDDVSEFKHQQCDPASQQTWESLVLLLSLDVSQNMLGGPIRQRLQHVHF